MRTLAPLVVLTCVFALAVVPLSAQPSPRPYPVLSSFPARYFPYCTSESFPDILVPGRGVEWNVTVRPCGYNAVSVFGMKVTPFPGFEPSLRRNVYRSIGRIGLGDMNFTPGYAFFPQVLNGTSRQALFNATVTSSTPAGYYQHDTVFDYNGPDGVPRESNVTQTVKDIHWEERHNTPGAASSSGLLRSCRIYYRPALCRRDHRSRTIVHRSEEVSWIQ